MTRIEPGTLERLPQAAAVMSAGANITEAVNSGIIPPRSWMKEDLGMAEGTTSRVANSVGMLAAGESLPVSPVATMPTLETKPTERSHTLGAGVAITQRDGGETFTVREVKTSPHTGEMIVLLDGPKGARLTKRLDDLYSQLNTEGEAWRW